MSQGTDTLHVRPGDEVVAVPWGYDSACTPTLWTEGLLEWAGPGAEVFRGFYQRRHAGGDRPVIDVLGGHNPYPSAAWLAGPTNPPRDEWLPAEVYFDMLEALPRAPDRRGPNESYRAELSAAAAEWLDVHPQHADRFPATIFHDRPRPGR